MPTYNNCPPSDEPYCLNGGDCFYIPEDPSVYICSCFMPYYGPRCEHEAQKGVIHSVSQEEYEAQGPHHRRSVDRALIITALVFVVITFIGVMLLTFYWSRKRRGAITLPWKTRKLVSFGSSTDSGRTECGVQASFGDSEIPPPISNQSAYIEFAQKDSATMANQTVSSKPSCATLSDHTDRIQEEEEILRALKEPYLVRRPNRPNKTAIQSNDHVAPARSRVESKQNVPVDFGSGESGRINQQDIPEMGTKPNHRAGSHHREYQRSSNRHTQERLDVYGDESPTKLNRTVMASKRPKSNKMEEYLIRLPPKSPVLHMKSQDFIDRNANNVFSDLSASSEPIATTSISPCPSHHSYTDSSNEVHPYSDLSHGYESLPTKKKQCAFIVASEHDALLSDLYNRGQQFNEEAPLILRNPGP